MFFDIINENHQLFIGLIAGLIPTVITLYTQKKIRETERRNWLSRNREAFLVEWVDILVGQMLKSKTQPLTIRIFTWIFDCILYCLFLKANPLLVRLADIKSPLVTYGSARSIRLWNEFSSNKDNSDSSETIKSGEKFLRSIREDLGIEGHELQPGELLATLLSPEDRQQVLDDCKGERYGNL